MANYKALRFSDPISMLADKLVKRMIEKSSGTGGKYVSIHLRFEEVCILFVTSILILCSIQYIQLQLLELFLTIMCTFRTW